MATVPGIDVSYWDAGIDWPKVRATGQRFVFAKATEGITYKDPTFDDNWFGAKSAGLLRGAYHFFRCNVDAKKQADYFIDYVKTVKDNGELPPVLDLETNDGMTKDKIVPAVKIWLDRVESAFGKKPIIYSGQYFLQDYLVEAGGGPPTVGEGLSALAGAVSQSICGGDETHPAARLVQLDDLAIQR